jgi:hypothetical protein
MLPSMNRSRLTPVAVLLATFATIWFSGCGPSSPPPPPQVPANAQSAAAAAITQHLEYGGEFFAVVDIQGELSAWGDRYADLLHQLLAQIPGNSRPNLDYHALFDRLGLYGIAGGGLSSWRANGEVFHHNRAFLYVPGGRQGLLQVFGGAPVPFVAPSLAPIDSDVALESTIDLKSLTDLAFTYVRDIGGPAALQQALVAFKSPIVPAANVTWQWLAQHADTRMIFIARVDPANPIHVGTLSFPHIDFLLGLDGFADLFARIQPLLSAFSTIAEHDGVQTATVSIPLGDSFAGYTPELLADSKSARLYFASRPEFANVTVFGQGPRLTISSDFQASTAGLPTAGNGLSYISKNGLESLISAYSLSLSSLPAAARQSVSQTAFADFEHLPHGVGSTQVNLPDGILVQSIAPQSNKSILLIGPLLAVGLAGALAETYSSTLAVPVFDQVQVQSSTKAVTNNLRMLASAGQQYMLDQGKTQAAYQDVVGTSNEKYIRSITPVAGENYQDVVITQNTTQLSVTTAAGEAVIYNL